MQKYFLKAICVSKYSIYHVFMKTASAHLSEDLFIQHQVPTKPQQDSL